VTSSAANPVKPTAKKELSIEFIGDSITCAYGVGADNQYVGFSTGTEDFSKSYAYLTAELIDADYSAVSYSGHGIISGYTSDGSLNTSMLVPPVYENVAKNAEYAVPWDFDAHPSDVVVLNLGTNDDSYASKDLETRAAAYQAEYVKFLAQIRKCNPDAVIICTLGIMGCEELYPYIEAAVKEFGDSKVTCYQSPTQNITGDGIGADWHPSPKTHQLNAYLLADKICTVLGREYSRVGVDFAADGEYGAEIDDTNGANAWPYYAEWNKSLNLNISAGGTDAADITAYVRGLDLPAGSYELSFDVKGAENIEFPFAVRNAANEYCKGTVSGTGGKAEFTLKSAAEGCEIVFLLGEISSANLTFENVKLYKTA
jgi:lysophospholipase L1-like esterase